MVPPDPALLESMRSIGYTVESAVADVIDNSIAADAAERRRCSSASAGPFEIAVVDDGSGMARNEAVSAMRLAATSPTKERGPRRSGALWARPQDRLAFPVPDSDRGDQEGRSPHRASLEPGPRHRDRRLGALELEPREVDGLAGRRHLDDIRSGTLVHWGDLDQLAMTEGHEQADLDRIALRIRDHIALVFHLFNAGEGVHRKIRFRMNGGPILPIDPFMSTSAKIQKTEWEPIDVEGQTGAAQGLHVAVSESALVEGTVDERP